MNKKEYNSVLVPKYMHDFSCIGPACEDSCCTGWAIYIDKHTFERYSKVKTGPLKRLLKKHIILNNNSEHENDADYARVLFDQQQRCPFLNEDKLCNIQLELGEDYLSRTCYSYPRNFNLVDDILEVGCSASCPEIVRLALFNPDPMEFDQIEVPPQSNYSLSRVLNTGGEGNSITKHFWLLRVFTIKLLQSRQFHLWERLIIMGFFFNKIQELIDTNCVGQIEKEIEHYNTLIEDQEQIRKILADIPAANRIQVELINIIAGLRYNYTAGKANQRYLECYQEFLNGIGYGENLSSQDIADRYNESYQKYFLPWYEHNEYVFENYLVNFVFINLIPSQSKVFDNYSLMIIYYALIKVFLVGIAAYHQGLNDDLVVKLIQSLSKNIELYSSFLESIYQTLTELDLLKMAYMAILIRN